MLGCLSFEDDATVVRSLADVLCGGGIVVIPMSVMSAWFKLVELDLTLQRLLASRSHGFRSAMMVLSGTTACSQLSDLSPFQSHFGMGFQVLSDADMDMFSISETQRKVCCIPGVSSFLCEFDVVRSRADAPSAWLRDPRDFLKAVSMHRGHV